MAVRPVVTWPHPALRQPCPDVTGFDAALSRLVADLTDTLSATRGLGITAPHIGETARVTVIRLEHMSAPLVLVNPKITFASTALASHPEGSLSMPGVVEDVSRAAEVAVAYVTAAGEPAEMRADGFLAACLQHEIDQLDGIFWIERLSRLKRDRIIKRHQKAAKTRD